VGRISGCQGNSPGLHPAFDHPRISWPGKGMSHRPDQHSDGSCLFLSAILRECWSSLPAKDQKEVGESFVIFAASALLLTSIMPTVPT